MNSNKVLSNKVALVTTLSLSVFGLSGCSSTNEMISTNFNQMNGEPNYNARQTAHISIRSAEEIRAQQIRNSTVEQLQKLVVYSTKAPEIFERITVQQVGLTTEVTFVSSKKGFFPVGVYQLNKIERPEDRNGLVFIDLVLNATRKVLDAVKDKTGQVVIEATYSAQADGQPIRSLRYKGEYGDAIKLPAEITTLNNKPVAIKVVKGQPINNEQLAALRAVSMAAFFHGAVKPHVINDKFVLTTSDAQGAQHRWVELTVKIAPTP